MNPSASGWIDKFGHLVNQLSQPSGDFYFYDVYKQLRAMGFTYGMNVAIPNFVDPAHKLTQDEMAKINLLYGLYSTYVIHRGNEDFNAFLNEIFDFYQDLEVGRINFLEKILSGSKTSAQLETLLDSRIHLDTNVLTRSFNSLLTNTMLFVDVLTLEAYLKGRENLQRYARNLEYMSINIAYQALSSREEQAEEDRLLELFKASMTFMEDPLEEVDLGYRNKLEEYKGSPAAPYFLDLACLAVWEDARLQGTESDFVSELGRELGFEEAETRQALVEVTAFLGNHSGELQIFRREKFYDGVSSLVGKLIRRNSKRLQKELSQSRELVYLLSKSTVKDLSAKERQQVQDQLLDIFKSIPSLAIFMLPGGAILLPIFIKLIPKMLPSSFDENRVDKKA